MAITVSLIFFPSVWDCIRPYLHIVSCAPDGGTADPRIRIEFLGLPEHLARELANFVMPCVACEAPNLPLRRRVGDDWTRLYYAPCCPVAVRPACSKGRAAELEYERFKGIDFKQQRAPAQQLALF